MVHIILGVTDHDASVGFYQKIGFIKLESGDTPTKFTLFTDGQMKFLLSQDTMPYTGLIYYDENQTSRVKVLEDSGTSFFWKQEDDSSGNILQAMFEVIPDTFAINLVSSAYEVAELPQPEFSLGLFAEFSIPVKDYQAIASTLEPLGFKSTGSHTEPYPWGIIYDGLIPIGLHQVDDFDSNTLTYFTPDSASILRELQDRELDVKMQGDSNGTLTAPDGQKIFIFIASKEEVEHMSGIMNS